MRRIKNAIILAAGRGSRMKELTDDKPKCMQLIKGKTVIQRTIEVFKYKNINKIIVITGYKSNVLRKHLNSLFDNIIFIKNKKWKTTNSIYSMFLASDYLNDSIVIDSDIYINNIKDVRTEISESGYTAVKESRPEEWQILAKNGIITDVKKKGSYKLGLPIIDLSYWKEEDSYIIADHLKELVKDTSNLQKYWDEIPMIDFRNELRLRRYDVDKDSLMEFDTKEDLEEIRRIL